MQRMERVRMKIITHCDREELTQPVFTLMDAFEYPELHDESIYVNNFFRQLCKLMAVCGVRDFGWKASYSRGLLCPARIAVSCQQWDANLQLLYLPCSLWLFQYGEGEVVTSNDKPRIMAHRYGGCQWR
jgi:hypothetical protein